MYLRKYILCNVPFPERILQPDERHIANDDLHVCFFLRFLSVEVPDNYHILYIKIFLRNCIVDNKNICAIIILPSG